MNKFSKKARAKDAREVKKAKDAKALYERYKNDDSLPRYLVEQLKLYIDFSEVTRRDIIDEEYDRACDECEKIIKKCEENGMVFVGTFVKPEPLEIYWERKTDLVELLEKGAFNEEEQYQIFKSWFFNHAITTVWEAENVFAKVSHKTLTHIQKKAPTMWERLKAEGRAYYEKAGYYEAKKRMSDALEKKKEQIRSWSDEECYKVVAVEKDGKRFWITD